MDRKKIWEEFLHKQDFSILDKLVKSDENNIESLRFLLDKAMEVFQVEIQKACTEHGVEIHDMLNSTGSFDPKKAIRAGVNMVKCPHCATQLDTPIRVKGAVETRKKLDESLHCPECNKPLFSDSDKIAYEIVLLKGLKDAHSKIMAFIASGKKSGIVRSEDDNLSSITNFDAHIQAKS